MAVRDDLAAIVERLKAIEQIFAQYGETIRTAQERDRELKVSPQPVRAEITFDETSKRETQTEASRQYRTQEGIRRVAGAAFVAAALYAGFAAIQLQEMHTQTQQVFHQSEVENADASYKAAQWREQLKVAQDNVAAIQRQMRQDQRAWVAPYDAGFKVELGDEIRGLLFYKNVGKTPARIVHGIFNGVMIGRKEFITFDYSYPHSSRFALGVVFPNYQSPVFGVPIHRPNDKSDRYITMTKELSDQFRADQIIFVVYGKINYVDVFAITHWVQFCNMFYHVRDGYTGEPPTASGQCASYNNVDSD